MSSMRLPFSTLSIPPLGFGCAYLVAGFELGSSRRLVDAAFDGGIRHFDVAPLYGMGTAEDVLGVAFASRRDRVTIATKVGIARPRAKPHIMLARALSTPLRKYASGFTRKLGGKISGATPRGQFELSFVERSLEESLKRLKTDYVDLLLLHEATASDITDELLRFLEGRRQAGAIRAAGVASAYERLIEIDADILRQFDAHQYSWSVLDAGRTPPQPQAFTITHRAILNALGPIQAWFAEDEAARCRLSAAAGVDLGANDILADVLLAAALEANQSGIVLAASRKLGRVRRFAEIIDNIDLRRAGRALTSLWPAGAVLAKKAHLRQDERLN